MENQNQTSLPNSAIKIAVSIIALILGAWVVSTAGVGPAPIIFGIASVLAVGGLMSTVYLLDKRGNGLGQYVRIAALFLSIFLAIALTNESLMGIAHPDYVFHTVQEFEHVKGLPGIGTGILIALLAVTYAVFNKQINAWLYD